METRYHMNRTAPEWEGYQARHHVNRNSLMENNPKLLSRHFPDLTTIINTTPGTRIEVEYVDYDFTHDAQTRGMPHLERFFGYHLFVEANIPGTRKEQSVRRMSGMTSIHVPTFYGPRLGTHFDEGGCISALPFNRQIDPNGFLMVNGRDYSASEYQAALIKDPVERMKLELEYFFNQITQVKDMDREVLLFEDIPLKTQLEQFEATLLKRGGLLNKAKRRMRRS